MTHTAETGHVTGTADKDYDLVWFTERCLNNVLRLETFVADAERGGDNELAVLFRKAQADSKKGAEIGKRMLRSRLAVQGQGVKPAETGRASCPGGCGQSR